MNNYDKILRNKEAHHITNMPNVEQDWNSFREMLDNTPDGNAVPTKRALGKMRRMFLLTGAAAIIGTGIYYFTKKIHHNSNISERTNQAIKPLLNDVNVPYKDYTVNNQLGDTIITENGSVIIFPKNAMVDNKGNVVNGNVTVSSRELIDPIDMMLAGVPMTYDSAGKTYDFISSGMIDLIAKQSGNLLSVNPNAKPIVKLVTTSTANSNLYQLNASTGVWTNKGKPTLQDFSGKSYNLNFTKSKATNDTIDLAVTEKGATLQQVTIKANEYVEAAPTKPIAPIKASGKNPVIVIEIDPASFDELKIYDGLKFEIVGGDKFVETDSDIDWDYVKLETITKGELYKVIFTKQTKTLSYVAKPVLEKNEYNQALEKYNKLLTEYENRLDGKAFVNTSNFDTQRNTSAIKDKSNKKVKMTAATAKPQVIKSEVANLDDIIALREKALAERWKIIEEKKILADSFMRINNNILQSFEIDGFGIWNCDEPIIKSDEIVSANFKDNAQNKLNIPTHSTIVEGENGITKLDDNKIRYKRGKKSIIFGAVAGKIAYKLIASNEQLMKDKTNNAFDINLSPINTEDKSYKGIKAAILRIFKR